MLGISIYPYKEKIEETIAYIEKASKLGYKRMFLNLLISKEEEINFFIESNKNIIKKAKENGFEIFVDVNPEIFRLIGIKDMDLSFFKDLGVDGIRLDGVFDGNVEAELTYNEYDIKIELNASQNTKYIENILTKKPNIKNLVSCHNFYPQKYSGLTEEFYIKTSKISKSCNLRLAAFITSNNNAHGPHIVDDNLPTLEIHRYLDIAIQLKHLIALGYVDDIIISNSFASDEELERVAKIYTSYITLKIDNIENLSENEKIILNNRHNNRADRAKGMIRSSLGRIKYKDLTIVSRPHNNKFIEKGTVYICNDNYGQYKGEIAIALEILEINPNKINIIGKINKDEIFLLDYITEYTRFKFEY